MNAPEDDLANSDRMAKSKIKNGLGNANNISKEAKKKQGKLRYDLEYPKTRSTELEEQEKEQGSMRKDLDNANSRIKELEGKEKELGSLRRDLENANKRIMELKVKEKELETLQKDSQKETSPPIEHIADKQKTEENFPAKRLNKEAFRIDFYPHEGHYQGRVVHLLTEKSKAFTGIDHKVIADFINEHLPQPEESVVVKPELVAPVPAKPSLGTQIQVFKAASIRKFTLVQEGKFRKERSITHDKIFQVTIVVDPMGSIVEENLPYSCEISVFAKRMGGGFKQILGKSRGQVTTAGEFDANVHCSPLPAGIYRFVAFGTINIKDDLKKAVVGFNESSIVCVT